MGPDRAAYAPSTLGGRPRKTNVRDVLNAVLYILRTGCQWRYLPLDFPPRSTVWRDFDQWRNDGTLDKIHDLLRRKVRADEKPYHPRTTASVDSQSVDSTSGGEQRGRVVTYHCMTIEFDSGEGLKFCLYGNDDWLIVEGDCGESTYQGTRCQHFQRQ